MDALASRLGADSPAASAKIIEPAITFDDVLLLPARSDFAPADADVRTRLTRRVALNIPLVSAPMDTVTESGLAIALAQEGGLGFIHKNLADEAQALEVEKVKRSENGVILDPVTLPPNATLAQARQVMRDFNVSGIPIVDALRRDARFCRISAAGMIESHPHDLQITQESPNYTLEK